MTSLKWEQWKFVLWELRVHWPVTTFTQLFLAIPVFSWCIHLWAGCSLGSNRYEQITCRTNWAVFALEELLRCTAWLPGYSMDCLHHPPPWAGTQVKTLVWLSFIIVAQENQGEVSPASYPVTHCHSRKNSVSFLSIHLASSYAHGCPVQASYTRGLCCHLTPSGFLKWISSANQATHDISTWLALISVDGQLLDHHGGMALGPKATAHTRPT